MRVQKPGRVTIVCVSRCMSNQLTLPAIIESRSLALATYNKLELVQYMRVAPYTIPHLLQDQIEQGSLVWTRPSQPVGEDFPYLRSEASHGIPEKLAPLRIETMLVRFKWQLFKQQSKVETGRHPDVCVWNVALDPLLCEDFELLMMITQKVISRLDQCTVRLNLARGRLHYCASVSCEIVWGTAYRRGGRERTASKRDAGWGRSRDVRGEGGGGGPSVRVVCVVGGATGQTGASLRRLGLYDCHISHVGPSIVMLSSSGQSPDIGPPVARRSAFLGAAKPKTIAIMRQAESCLQQLKVQAHTRVTT